MGITAKIHHIFILFRYVGTKRKLRKERISIVPSAQLRPDEIPQRFLFRCGCCFLGCEFLATGVTVLTSFQLKLKFEIETRV